MVALPDRTPSGPNPVWPHVLVAETERGGQKNGQKRAPNLHTLAKHSGRQLAQEGEAELHCLVGAADEEVVGALDDLGAGVLPLADDRRRRVG